MIAEYYTYSNGKLFKNPFNTPIEYNDDIKEKKFKLPSIDIDKNKIKTALKIFAICLSIIASIAIIYGLFYAFCYFGNIEHPETDSTSRSFTALFQVILIITSFIFAGISFKDIKDIIKEK